MFGGKKFSNDDADQAETDVYFQDTQDRREVEWQDDTGQAVFLVSSERADEFQFFRVGGEKAGVQVDDAAEHGNGDCGDNDRFHVVAKPDDEDGSHGRFGKAV